MRKEHSLRSERTRVPPAPHPDRRREPLPEQQPKATQEDPHALQAIRAILDSPSYRLAERDVDFLARDDVHGPRLQLEYLKPDTVLREHGVDHTIVVFGSTRIPEPGAAQRRVETLRAEQAVDPMKRRSQAKVGSGQEDAREKPLLRGGSRAPIAPAAAQC